jgi:YesN/AraC family two-component response regulator
MRVLVVDDQKRTRQSLRLLLGTMSCIQEIREAADGVEAVALVQEFMPDIILMDARMPEMDGIEATGIIKEQFPQVRIIVLSMYPEYRESALNAGADFFVSKGEPPEDLMSVMGEMVGGM